MNIITLPQPQQPAVRGTDAAPANAKKNNFESKLDNAVKAAAKEERLEKTNNSKPVDDTKIPQKDKPEEKTAKPDNDGSSTADNAARGVDKAESKASEAPQKANNEGDDKAKEEERQTVKAGLESQMLLAQIVPAPMLVQNIIEANNAESEFAPAIFADGSKNQQANLQIHGSDAQGSGGAEPPYASQVINANGLERQSAPGKETVAPIGALFAQETASDNAKAPIIGAVDNVQHNVIVLPEIPAPADSQQQVVQQVTEESVQIAVASEAVELNELNASAKTEAKIDAVIAKENNQAVGQNETAVEAIQNANSGKQQEQLMADHLKSDLVKKMQASDSNGLQIGAADVTNRAGGETERAQDTGDQKLDKNSSPSPFAGIKLPHETARSQSGAIGSATADSSAIKVDSGILAAQQQTQQIHQADGIKDTLGNTHLGAKAQVLDQVIMKVYEGAKDGSQKVTVSLNPAELGKVEVKIDFAPDGKANLNISADSRATLDILQKHSRELERGLLDAGIKTDMGSLSFNLNGQNQNGFYASQDDFKWQGNPYARYVSDSEETGDINPAIAAKVYSISPDAVNILV